MALVNFGGNPFAWNRTDYQNFPMGGPQMVGAGQQLDAIRNDVKPLEGIDPILMGNALSLLMTPDNALMAEARKRYANAGAKAGLSDAASQAYAARQSRKGFMGLSDVSDAYQTGLQRLYEEAKRQKESIGPTPSPEAAQWQGFWENFGS